MLTVFPVTFIPFSPWLYIRSEIFAVCRHSVVLVLSHVELSCLACESIFYLHRTCHVQPYSDYLHQLYLVEVAGGCGVNLAAHVVIANGDERQTHAGAPVGAHLLAGIFRTGTLRCNQFAVLVEAYLIYVHHIETEHLGRASEHESCLCASGIHVAHIFHAHKRTVANAHACHARHGGVVCQILVTQILKIRLHLSNGDAVTAETVHRASVAYKRSAVSQIVLTGRVAFLPHFPIVRNGIFGSYGSKGYISQ